MRVLKIKRLEVEQHGSDYDFPIGSILRDTQTGAAYELFRRRPRGGPKQTWWVKVVGK